MLPIIWTRFPNSKLATALSLFASAAIVAGISGAIKGEVAGGIVTAVCGVALRLLAGYIARRKETKKQETAAKTIPEASGAAAPFAAGGPARAAATPGRCPHCGSKTEPGDQFCTQCGGKL